MAGHMDMILFEASAKELAITILKKAVLKPKQDVQSAKLDRSEILIHSN